MPDWDSGTISDIVPCIVGHDNPTEENSEYSTQLKQLHEMKKHLNLQVMQYESRRTPC